MPAHKKGSRQPSAGARCSKGGELHWVGGGSSCGDPRGARVRDQAPGRRGAGAGELCVAHCQSSVIQGPHFPPTQIPQAPKTPQHQLASPDCLLSQLACKQVFQSWQTQSSSPRLSSSSPRWLMRAVIRLMRAQSWPLRPPQRLGLAMSSQQARLGGMRGSRRAVSSPWTQPRQPRPQQLWQRV